MVHPSLHLKRTLPCILLALFLLNVAGAQSIYTYQDLSNIAYARQKDSLKKAWVCPAIYKEKTTQKKYKELWDSRTDFVLSAIGGQRFVVEKEIYSYLNGILTQLVKANPKSISVLPMLLVDRNAAVNAYAIGGNMIAVNLGLISFAQSREEMSLVIAHELAHNILNHPDKAMREQAEWLTSAEYETSLKEILNSKYDRYSRLKKVFEGYSINSSRHHRYHESDADSLAIVLLSNSHIDFDARFFLRLDSADMVYQQPLQKPVADYFATYGLAVEPAWSVKRSKGLSTRNYNFKDTAVKLDDSLKTHPDCAVRYAATLKYTTPNNRLTAIPAGLKQKANEIIIWTLFDRLNLTSALFRILQEKDDGNKNEWYDFMVCNIISGLYHSDKMLQRFNAVGIVPKEIVSKSYFELQTTLEQLPKETLEQYYHAMQSLPLWKHLPDDSKGLQSLMASVVAESDNGSVQTKKAAQQFIATYGNSMYCEFADHFTGK